MKEKPPTVYKWSLVPMIIRTKTLTIALSVPHSYQENGARLPWGSRAWEPACRCRGREFNPYSRKSPHATGQPNPCAITTEPEIHNKRSHGNEKSARSNWRVVPSSPQLETAHVQQQRPSTAKNKVNSNNTKRTGWWEECFCTERAEGGDKTNSSSVVESICMHAQSCLALCDPMDWSLPGSSVHGIF